MAVKHIFVREFMLDLGKWGGEFICGQAMGLNLTICNFWPKIISQTYNNKLKVLVSMSKS